MASSKNTPTAAGAKASDPSALPEADKHRLMDAIDQMFAEFELVYHNQFHKAFADRERLAYAKRLWLSHLGDCQPEEILAAARQATRESEYLPTVRGVLKHIEADRTHGLPDARDAYREACLAPSPKAAQSWSHPAVYWAGAACDWFFLANASERESWPVYERHYRTLAERVGNGETLPMPSMPALPAEIHEDMTPEQRHAAMEALRKAVDL